jgi:hypothetical protein
VRAQQRAAEEQFGHEVPVAHAVQAVAAHGGKAECLRQPGAVDGKGIAGQRAGPEREHRRAPGTIGQPFHITRECPEVGQAPMRERDRLCPLQVRISRHESLHVSVCLFQQLGLQMGDLGLEIGNLLQYVQPLVGGDLVVPAAAGVQLARGGADDLPQSPFDGGVDVLIVRLDLKAAVSEFGMNLLQAIYELRRFVLSEDTGLGEGVCVGDATADIGVPQTHVK